jgi:hypothetical protein
MQRSGRYVLIVTGLLVAAGFLPGCGGSGASSNNVHVSGSVTFKKKPVAHGKVYFNPDKETAGTTGFADIKDGRYDTAAAGGLPAPEGDVVVRVEGFDGPEGRLLFEHEFAMRLDSSTSSRDIPVPDSAAVTQPKNPDPLP